MSFGDRNLIKADFEGTLVEIMMDGEGVEEGVIGRGWDVVSVLAKRHTRYTGKVDWRSSPEA